MGIFEFGLLCGGIAGGFLGFWLGRVGLLIRMRRDEHEGVESQYRRRRDKYLGRKD